MKKMIRLEYWTEVDRSLETKSMFIILGGQQRPLVLIEKKRIFQMNNRISYLLF